MCVFCVFFVVAGTDLKIEVFFYVKEAIFVRFFFLKKNKEGF